MEDTEIKLQYLVKCYGVKDAAMILRLNEHRVNDWMHTGNFGLFGVMARNRINNEFARVAAEDKVFELRNQDKVA